jgi:hypothetical protein
VAEIRIPFPDPIEPESTIADVHDAIRRSSELTDEDRDIGLAVADNALSRATTRAADLFKELEGPGARKIVDEARGSIGMRTVGEEEAERDFEMRTAGLRPGGVNGKVPQQCPHCSADFKREDGVRELLGIYVFEVSLTPGPANRGTRIVSMKSERERRVRRPRPVVLRSRRQEQVSPGPRARGARSSDRGQGSEREEAQPSRPDQDLRGLMSQGLLRQPGGFEGLGFVLKLLVTDDLAVTHGIDRTHAASLHLEAAPLSVKPGSGGENNFVPHRDVLSRNRRNRRPRLPKALNEVPDALVTPVDATVGTTHGGEVELGVAVHLFKEGVDIPTPYASTLRRTISTFTSDIAYSDSPAASRASSRVAKPMNLTIFSARRV